MEIQTGIGALDEGGHPPQLTERCEGIRQAAALHDDRLQPGEWLQQEGVAILDHRPEPGPGKRRPEAGPGGQHPQDVAEGGEAEQNQIHPSILFVTLGA